MRLLGQFQVCLLFNFFLRKDFELKKHQNAKKKKKKKKTISTLLKAFVRAKKLLPLLVFVCLISFCLLVFACDVFLSARNLFVKKEINKQA